MNGPRFILLQISDAKVLVEGFKFYNKDNAWTSNQYRVKS